MEKSTVIEIIRTFSKEELARFGDFVSSPYFNKKSNVAKLYTVVRKFAPGFPPENIKKEEVWKKIFPGKKYNYGIMKNLIHELNKLTLIFLELEKHFTKNFEIDLNLLEQYKLRQLKPLFLKKMKETKTRVKTSKTDNFTFCYSYFAEYAKMTYLDYEYFIKAKEPEPFLELNKSLNLHYFTGMLYHNTNNLQLAFNRQAAYDQSMHENMLRMYENSPYKNIYTDCLYLNYKCLSSLDDAESYYKFKDLFFKNRHLFAETVQYDLVVGLLNFCRNNASRGNKIYQADEFVYIKIMIEDNLYKSTSYGWMDQYLFMNAVMCSCRAGNFEWAERFIEKYSSELLDEIREQYVNYAYVTLNLRRDKFEKALYYLSKCKNVGAGDKLNIRVFEFNAYYELGYYDELMALADTTKHFLKNETVFSKDERDNYKNYVMAITKLMDYKCNVGNRRKEPGFLDSVMEFISDNRILNKAWLLKKAEELKKIKL